MQTIKKPFVKLGHVKLDVSNARIHPNTYKYIRFEILGKLKNEADIIYEVKSLGTAANDKIICLANLFFACVKEDKIGLMQRIMDVYKNDKPIQKFIANAYDRDYTPLMHAVYRGRIESVKFLLSFGADINNINIKNETVFSAAFEGLKDQLKDPKNKYADMLITNKFREIDDFLKWWNLSDTTAEMRLDAIKIDNYNDVKPKTIVQVQAQAKAVIQQPEIVIPVETFKMPPGSLLSIDRAKEDIKELVETYIENSNTFMMKKLFNEINVLIDNKIINTQAIKTILEPFIDIIMMDFDDVYPILKLDEAKVEASLQPKVVECLPLREVKVEASLQPKVVECLPLREAKVEAKIEANVETEIIQLNQDVNDEFEVNIKFQCPINIKCDLVKQITDLLDQYINKYDKKMMKKLFNDINSIVKSGFITSIDMKIILEPFVDTLFSDYFREVSILKL